MHVLTVLCLLCYLPGPIAWLFARFAGWLHAVKKFMDKRLLVHVQGARKVEGTLRGFDIFLNLVVDKAVDATEPGRPVDMDGGMTVSGKCSKSELFQLWLSSRACYR